MLNRYLQNKQHKEKAKKLKPVNRSDIPTGRKGTDIQSSAKGLSNIVSDCLVSE